MKYNSAAVFFMVIGCFGFVLGAENWPSFRGPNASGIGSSGTATQWDLAGGKSVLWKADLGGAAHASPVVWDNRVFVTSVAGGEDWRDDSVKHTWSLFAYDKNNGKLIWKQTAAESKPRAGRHQKASQANSTPVTNGRYVAAIMGSEGLFCYDAGGKLLWKKDLGLLNPGLANDPTSHWGHASSPVIYKDMVIVQVDRHQNSFLAAYQLANGKEIWNTPRNELPGWSTPTIYEGKDRVELITHGGHYVRAYDPMTGKELWRFADDAEVKQPTPIIAGDLIYITGGYPRGRPIFALRPGGSGDISAEKPQQSRYLVWKTERGGPYTPTPLVYHNYLYAIQNNGVLGCYNAKTGEKIYEERLDGEYSASPVATGVKIYFAGEDGAIRVVKAGPDFQLLATNKMNEPCYATPAISDGTLFIRTLKMLYAIGSH